VLKKKTKDRVTRTPLKTRYKLRCSGKVSSSCSTCGTHHVILEQWKCGWLLQRKKACISITSSIGMVAIRFISVNEIASSTSCINVFLCDNNDILTMVVCLLISISDMQAFFLCNNHPHFHCSKITWWVPQVEQELLTFPEHLVSHWRNNSHSTWGSTMKRLSSPELESRF
jgi:hypothetical protein